MKLSSNDDSQVLTRSMNATPSWTTTLHGIENVSVAKNQSSTDSDSDREFDFLVILLPILVILCLLFVILTIAWGLKRNRMEKLRQHLMPMYSLEASDSGQEWEVDLLSQEVRHGTESATSLNLSSPCLKFNTMHSEL